MNHSTLSLVLCVSWVVACGGAKVPQTPAGARSSSAAAREAEARPSEGDLTREERERFLGAINDSCADTYCEGAFGFEFDGLECRFKDAACAISFVMFTDEPTRPGLVPARFTSSPEDEEPFVAVIEAVVPPSECDPAHVGLEQGGSPCTIVEAGCVLAPIRSIDEFESLHWDMLSSCVFALEDAVLPAGADDDVAAETPDAATGETE